MVTTIVIRFVAVYANSTQLESDPDAYRAIARTIAEHGVFGLTDSRGQPIATAFRPPLYPYLLSWFVRDGNIPIAAVATLHALLGAITVLCTLLISQRLVDGGTIRSTSIVASLLVAIDPILLQQSSLLMTETVATAIAALILWWWSCRFTPKPTIANAFVLSLFLAAAYLCRPTFLVWGVLMVLAAPFIRSPRFPKSRWGKLTRGLAVASALVTAVGIWTARNVKEIGHPVWATSHGGYTLLLANNPSFYDYLRSGRWGEAWDAEPFLVAYQHRFNDDPRTAEFWKHDWQHIAPAAATGVTEHQDDRRTYEAAKATIQREPGMFLWSCVVRAGRLWSPLPHHTPGRGWTKIALVGGYYLALYVFVVIGLWRIGRMILRPSWWSLLFLALTLTAVHAVYWSNLRMRAPIIPGLAIVAAAGLSRRSKADEDDNDHEVDEAANPNPDSDADSSNDTVVNNGAVD